jgi:hypothetical protein
MTISIDPSTPAVTTGTSNTAPTTPSFSPPANSLVVVLFGGGWNSSGTMSCTCTDSGSHTWTSPVNATGPSGNGGLAQIFESFFSAAPGAITVTCHITAAGSGGGSLIDIVVLTGAAANQTGAGTGQFVNSTGSTVGTLSVTTTQPGSWVWGVSDDTTSNPTTNWAPNANTVVDYEYHDTTDGIELVSWAGSGRTGTPGTTTFGGTWGASGKTNQCAVEILPALSIKPRIISQAVSRAAFR